MPDDAQTAFRIAARGAPPWGSLPILTTSSDIGPMHPNNK
jgi:hypothetical protein